MSMDAGGLAQMTYNSSFNGGSIGVPGSSFASRGKGSHIKRLSVPPTTVDESQQSANVSTPRTSRSHLLAGLRTAPKSATLPPTGHQQQGVGLDGGRHAMPSSTYPDRVPQTSTAATFPQNVFGTNTNLNQNLNMGLNFNRPMYTLPEQVLAPPAIDMGNGQMDGRLYQDLMSTNLYLAAQQQRLQQQLLNVTQQFQNLNLGLGQQQAMPTSPIPSMGFYQQQLQHGLQPIVQPVPGQPGLYSVYNPMTGQQSFVVDNSIQQQQQEAQAYQEHVQTPVTQTQAPAFHAEVSPPPESTASPAQASQPVSPPKGSPSPPQNVAPLPQPSANAFRRGHKKSSSFNPGLKTNTELARNGGNGPKSAAFPPTPSTGTFGPGQGRAGEHPIRQPRGPPSLEELMAKPTAKHEGSKNFATRQRRRAVHNLVRAGIERRGESRSHGSGGTNTPASETEFAFSGSDGDDCTVRSGSISSKPSLGSLRAAANGAIGSERKEKDRSSRASISSDEGNSVGKLTEGSADRTSSPKSPLSAAAVVAGQRTVSQGPERRKTPMLVLSSAEKRKTPVM